MNDAKITKMIKNVLFKNYLTDISVANPYKMTLCHQYEFSGEPNPSEQVKLILIGDLAKWCSIKQATSLN
ncbi:MAG: hypothetical protein WC527_01490 [Candidatus Margulisiibacteriota bacterium]